MDRVSRQRKRLDELVTEAGGTDRLLAERIKSAESYISQLRNSRSGISRKFCVRLEQAMNKPDGWMDQWLPEEFEPGEGFALEVREPPFNYGELSKAESRILNMWRTWSPEVKQYVFGQIEIANYTKDVLIDMFMIKHVERRTHEQIDKYVEDTVSETGEFKALKAP